MSGKFTIRTLLLVTVCVALATGWYSEARRNRINISLLQQHLRFKTLESDLISGRRKVTSKDDATPIGDVSLTKSLQLDRTDLTKVEIHVTQHQMEAASFRGSNLENAKLVGPGSAFQRAHFENARMRGATLDGGTSSFQYAMFDGADLTNRKIFRRPFVFATSCKAFPFIPLSCVFANPP
jgi:uncharacterized protein YjbI with pentapeptide repeats